MTDSKLSKCGPAMQHQHLLGAGSKYKNIFLGFSPDPWNQQLWALPQPEVLEEAMGWEPL